MDTGEIKVGDILTIDLPIKRRWWQLWKRRSTLQRKAFRVTRSVVHDGSGILHRIRLTDESGALWYDIAYYD